MNESIFQVANLSVTPWQIIGYIGVFLFGGRWAAQVYVSRALQRSTFPRLFWYMSIVGSLLLLMYFTFGTGDPVGILANMFPLVIASYNLFLDIKSTRIETTER